MVKIRAELNVFKTFPNSKFDQTNSDEAQILTTGGPWHHEPIPKRSRSKDQNFMIKSTKFELKLGFSPKREFRGISISNSFLCEVTPKIHPKESQQPFPKGNPVQIGFKLRITKSSS